MATKNGITETAREHMLPNEVDGAVHKQAMDTLDQMAKIHKDRVDGNGSDTLQREVKVQQSHKEKMEQIYAKVHGKKRIKLLQKYRKSNMLESGEIQTTFKTKKLFGGSCSTGGHPESAHNSEVESKSCVRPHCEGDEYFHFNSETHTAKGSFCPAKKIVRIDWMGQSGSDNPDEVTHHVGTVGNINVKDTRKMLRHIVKFAKERDASVSAYAANNGIMRLMTQLSTGERITKGQEAGRSGRIMIPADRVARIHEALEEETVVGKIKATYPKGHPEKKGYFDTESFGRPWAKVAKQQEKSKPKQGVK